MDLIGIRLHSAAPVRSPAELGGSVAGADNLLGLAKGGLQIVTDMFAPGTLTGVRREDIEAMQPSKVSMMPSGLLNTLNETEIQDLFAYLLSRGDPEHKMFQ